jgi:hypothetical protein
MGQYKFGALKILKTGGLKLLILENSCRKLQNEE